MNFLCEWRHFDLADAGNNFILLCKGFFAKKLNLGIQIHMQDDGPESCHPRFISTKKHKSKWLSDCTIPMLHMLHSAKKSDFSWGIMPSINMDPCSSSRRQICMLFPHTSMPCLSFCLRGGDGDDAATGAGPLGPWSGTRRDGHIKRVMFDRLMKTNSFLYTQIVGLELLGFLCV